MFRAERLCSQWCIDGIVCTFLPKPSDLLWLRMAESRHRKSAPQCSVAGPCLIPAVSGYLLKPSLAGCGGAVQSRSKNYLASQHLTMHWKYGNNVSYTTCIVNQCIKWQRCRNVRTMDIGSVALCFFSSTQIISTPSQRSPFFAAGRLACQG
jgi:hypothetical protein